MVMWQHQCNQSWRDHTYLYFYFFLTKTAVKSKWNKQISYFREMYISRNLLTSSSQQWWSHQCLPGMTRDIWMRLAGPSSSSSSWTIINSYFSYPANWISYYFANKVGKCCWTENWPLYFSRFLNRISWPCQHDPLCNQACGYACLEWHETFECGWPAYYSPTQIRSSDNATKFRPFCPTQFSQPVAGTYEVFVNRDQRPNSSTGCFECQKTKIWSVD